jgi:hypothetical protein
MPRGSACTLNANAVLARFNQFFGAREQSDAQEFLQLVMEAADMDAEAMHKEYEDFFGRHDRLMKGLPLGERTSEAELLRQLSDKVMSKKDVEEMGGDLKESRGTHMRCLNSRNPMRGMLGTSVTCLRCGASHVRTEWFLTVSLNTAPTLAGALGGAFNEEGERVEGYTCDECVRAQRFTRACQ